MNHSDARQMSSFTTRRGNTPSLGQSLPLQLELLPAVAVVNDRGFLTANLRLLHNVAVGWAFYLARRYGEAIEQLRRTTELDPNYAVTQINSFSKFLRVPSTFVPPGTSPTTFPPNPIMLPANSMIWMAWFQSLHQNRSNVC